MLRKQLEINVSFILENSVFSIRNASVSDQSLLRLWKNENREFFFNANLISVENQERWFRNFSERPDDHLFIIEYNFIDVGCIGLRRVDDHWDVYNVICGNKDYLKRGLLSASFKHILVELRRNTSSPVRLRVLKQNPAVDWYKRNGFVIKETHEQYFLMEFTR